MGASEDAGNREVGLLAVDAFLVSPSAGSSGVVEKTDVGGIGTSIHNHAIQHFLVHCIPCCVCEQENFFDLVFEQGTDMAGKGNFSTAQSAKHVLRFGKGCGLGPVLFGPNAMRVRKSGHGVECNNLKWLLFVVVRNEEGQAWKVSSSCERGESAEQNTAGVTLVKPHRDCWMMKRSISSNRSV